MSQDDFNSHAEAFVWGFGISAFIAVLLVAGNGLTLETTIIRHGAAHWETDPISGVVTFQWNDEKKVKP